MNREVRIDAQGNIMVHDNELGEPLSSSDGNSTFRRCLFFSKLKKYFIRPLCCFPEEAGMPLSTSNALTTDTPPRALCTSIPICGFAISFWFIIIAMITLSVISHVFWKKGLMLCTVLVGELIALTLHEFAHAAVAFYAGDTSVISKGYLTLDIVRYANPLLTFFIPLIMIGTGHIAIPGGAVSINEENIRSNCWMTLASLAGPFSDFCYALVIRCILEIVFYSSSSGFTMYELSLLCIIFFQSSAIIINMIPLPPFDGWGALSPHLPSSCFLKKIMSDPITAHLVSFCILVFMYLLIINTGFFFPAVFKFASVVFLVRESFLREALMMLSSGM